MKLNGRLKHIIRHGATSAASPAGQRRKRQGIRHAHPECGREVKGGARGRDRGGRDELNLWAAACTAPVLFLRGGELQHIRHCDVSHTVQAGRRCLLIKVLAINKVNGANRPRHPLLIPEMGENDPACTYRAITRMMRGDADERPHNRGSKDTTPLFRVRSKRTGKETPV